MPKSEDRLPLLEAIFEDPESDACRLVYADFLEETRSPQDLQHSQLIRLGCNLAASRTKTLDLGRDFSMIALVGKGDYAIDLMHLLHHKQTEPLRSFSVTEGEEIAIVSSLPPTSLIEHFTMTDRDYRGGKVYSKSFGKYPSVIGATVIAVDYGAAGSASGKPPESIVVRPSNKQTDKAIEQMKSTSSLRRKQRQLLTSMCRNHPLFEVDNYAAVPSPHFEQVMFVHNGSRHRRQWMDSDRFIAVIDRGFIGSLNCPWDCWANQISKMHPVHSVQLTSYPSCEIRISDIPGYPHQENVELFCEFFGGVVDSFVYPLNPARPGNFEERTRDVHQRLEKRMLDLVRSKWPKTSFYYPLSFSEDLLRKQADGNQAG